MIESIRLGASRLDEALSCTFVGAPDTVRDDLNAFLARTDADELTVGPHIFDRGAHLCSYELLAQVCGAATAKR